MTALCLTRPVSISWTHYSLLKFSQISLEERAYVILSQINFVHSVFAFSVTDSYISSYIFRVSKLIGVRLLLKLFFALFTSHLALATSLFHHGCLFLFFCDLTSIRGTAYVMHSVYTSINASVILSIELYCIPDSFHTLSFFSVQFLHISQLVLLTRYFSVVTLVCSDLWYTSNITLM